jgi:hypothetical protein
VTIYSVDGRPYYDAAHLSRRRTPTHSHHIRLHAYIALHSTAHCTHARAVYVRAWAAAGGRTCRSSRRTRRARTRTGESARTGARRVIVSGAVSVRSGAARVPRRAPSTVLSCGASREKARRHAPSTSTLLLLYCSSTAPLLLLYCSSTAPTLLLLYCSSTAPPLLLLYCSSTAPLLLLYCSSTAPPLLLLYCSSTAPLLLLYCSSVCSSGCSYSTAPARRHASGMSVRDVLEHAARCRRCRGGERTV